MYMLLYGHLFMYFILRVHRKVYIDNTVQVMDQNQIMLDNVRLVGGVQWVNINLLHVLGKNRFQW
jgi:hypothetical protein